ncbi:DALR anticodon-binding domain-containing protein [Streptomyces gobiensis]|uniref:DALR anticodon-binding domain-containing protein n=1 Tax=Streptomyces gobiensis TaxID=2875706 RepID=UPI001E3F52E6|nr:DALR anticodon-binding domain-containing protein [Streptomyces gobiensis]UGY93644.1 arginine--tRNA ligase [Streptomyces gobiensis]
MTPAQLSRTVLHTLRRAVEDGELPAAVRTPEKVTLRRPPHGDADYASNLALRLAPALGRPARQIAEILRIRLAQQPGIARVEVAGAGFLNITVRAAGRTAVVREAIAAGRRAQPAALPEDPARDAARWAAVTGHPVTCERRDSQPLFRVQYAHARTRALLTNARDLGFGPEPGSYETPAEAALIALLADSGRISEHGTPDRLARQLEAVAEAFCDVHDVHPILPRGDEKPRAAHRARLALAEATGAVLAGGLTQLGISAPNHL